MLCSCSKSDVASWLQEAVPGMLVALVAYAQTHSVMPKLPSNARARASLLGEETLGQAGSSQSSLGSAITQVRTAYMKEEKAADAIAAYAWQLCALGRGMKPALTPQAAAGCQQMPSAAAMAEGVAGRGVPAAPPDLRAAREQRCMCGGPAGAGRPGSAGLVRAHACLGCTGHVCPGRPVGS